MADAATAQNNPSALQSAALLGENKALAQRGPKPISATQPLRQPAQTAPRPAATGNTKADRMEQMKASRLQAKQQRKQRQAEQKKSAAQEKQDQKRFVRRDMLNDQMDRTMLATVAGVWTAILALIWFNLKLFWGGLVMKNRSRFISEPSMRPFKARFLPKWMAYAAILGADLIVITVILVAVMVFFLVMSVLIELASNPLSYFTSSDAEMIRPLLGQ